MPGAAWDTARPPTQASVHAVLVTPVREGEPDGWTRFQGASAAIGHYVRLAHDGRMSRNEAWEAICQYNAAMLRPPWPLERLAAEADRLWRLHVERNGPALERIDASAGVLPAFTLGAYLDDKSPMPEDIIAPRLLTPGGLLVLGGAPKVGKSDFLISLLAHMAAGVPFLGFAPPRPLRVFYLQAEIQYHYLRERLQGIRLPPRSWPRRATTWSPRPRSGCCSTRMGSRSRSRRSGLVFRRAAGHHLHRPDPEPVRWRARGQWREQQQRHAVLPAGAGRGLRDAVDPDAGVVLCHHTRKITKKLLAEDPFQALSGASSLRSFYTCGILMCRPDEDRPERKLFFELRNGPAIEPQFIDKVDGHWVEIDRRGERLVRREHGEKLDAERGASTTSSFSCSTTRPQRAASIPRAVRRTGSRTRAVSAARTPSANGSACSPPRAT